MKIGVPVFEFTLANGRGSRPSRLIEKNTRTAPIIRVITTVVRPATAPAEISVAKLSWPDSGEGAASAASGSILS